ncbi:MAG TPA: M15 family metallopeptidase [Leptospiraceae bacterium]|nr:M15 family metallopeptidase [Leptospiraceae bacterium]HMX32892.1 M15 family metallopeptidase [Leptospiraceae bacterium]HMY29823.1 M15 family metallopeptidase [Leptospiraceae bacterium]HMZ65195.1 M15 family metallopeptidase [Leptospiraceae bacterium]HNA07818.1 M15 family metallopeptidase [Leptospiraceae bacterium]
MIILPFLVIFFTQTLAADDRVGEALSKSPDFIWIQNSESIQIDLKYASANNFMKENLYGSYNKCYLHREANEKLKRAIQKLNEKKPKFKFVLFDCLRPRSIQYKLWDKVKGTSQEPYVANPKSGSIHNYGFALDLSILDETGKELDMGTPFDSFLPLSEPTKEEAFLKSGELTKKQWENRILLRNIMQDAGFIQRPNEWWHYDGFSAKTIRKNYKIIE